MAQTKFTNDYVNEMLQNEKEQYKEPSAEELSLIDETLKKAYKAYYPEVAKDEKLFADIKESKAEVFFLRLCSMQDKMKTDFTLDISHKFKTEEAKKDSVMRPDEALKYPDMLTSAEDMLYIFNSIIVKADKKLQDAMLSGNDKDIIAAYEDPLCQYASAFVSNETTVTRPSDIENIRQTGANMNTLNIIMDLSPEIQQMVGDMRADANFKYAASGLTPEYIHPKNREDISDTSERNHEIAAFIDANPKTVLALAVLSEQRAALGLPAEKFNTVAELSKRCQKSDVRDIAKRLNYADRSTSLKAATRLAEGYAKIEQTSRGGQHHTA